MARPIRIAITTGDADGIGTEIAAKALAKIGPRSGVHFYLWRSPQCPVKHLRQIDSKFKRITVSGWPEALEETPASSRELVDINSNLPPARWVEAVAKASLYGHIDGIATAPISKTGIIASGIKAIGHTEILKNVSDAENIFMGFVGKEFNVLLATGHMPLKEVSSRLSADIIFSALESADQMRTLLPPRKANLPIALVGLNPHAGEEGLIGHEEDEKFSQALERAKKNKIPVEGPLVPDAAFFPVNWKKYSVFVSPYHDQGLIPFKMIHGQDSGVHITMGLPFVRTSVDHGTAKNIFGKNKANPNSMIEAINWAIRLTQSRRTKS